MNWGKGIFLTFVVFAAIIISMVVISMKQGVNLVEKNYYEEEIAYQDQIDRMENYNALENQPSIQKTGNRLIITFSEELTSSMRSGKVQLYRPSSSAMDKKFNLLLNESGSQFIPLENLEKGLWNVKLSWDSESKEYFTSQSIVL